MDNVELLKLVFSGQYSFTRETLPEKLKISGILNLEILDKNTISYQEQGFYFLNKKKVKFFQERFINISNNFLKILKNDKSVLHEFNLEKKISFPFIKKHTHLCDKDEYNIILKINNFCEFEQIYTIKGPKKNTFVKTKYQKI